MIVIIHDAHRTFANGVSIQFLITPQIQSAGTNGFAMAGTPSCLSFTQAAWLTKLIITCTFRNCDGSAEASSSLGVMKYLAASYAPEPPRQ